MADAISPRRRQYVGHYEQANARQVCISGDKRRNERTDKHKDIAI